MADFNPNVLKQLIDQFADKEAEVNKRLADLTKEIERLAARSKESHLKADSINEDRQKILAMLEHYPALVARDSKKSAIKPGSVAKKAAKPSDEQPSDQKDRRSLQSNIEVTAPEDKSDAPKVAEPEQLKDINEALRKLFRP